MERKEKINRKAAEPNSYEENELNRHVRSSMAEIQKHTPEICHVQKLTGDRKNWRDESMGISLMCTW
jgi:hypothetical protein